MNFHLGHWYRCISSSLYARRIARNVTTVPCFSSFRLLQQSVNRVPLFIPLSMEQKRLVSDALVEVLFRPGQYICEEVQRALHYTTDHCYNDIFMSNNRGLHMKWSDANLDTKYGKQPYLSNNPNTVQSASDEFRVCLINQNCKCTWQ